MSYVIDEKFYRTEDGRPARVRIMVDDDASGVNPRDEANGALLFTYDTKYYTPDPLSKTPRVLDPALHQWAGSRPRGTVEALLIKRYAAIFHPDEVLYVGALGRYDDGTLTLDDNPDADQSVDGIAVVTRDSVREIYGDEVPNAHQAREVARSEVERYNQWARGDVYGYVAEVQAYPGACMDHDAELVDSCWGFIGADEIPYMHDQGRIGLGDPVEIDKEEYDELLEASQQTARAHG